MIKASEIMSKHIMRSNATRIHAQVGASLIMVMLILVVVSLLGAIILLAIVNLIRRGTARS